MALIYAGGLGVSDFVDNYTNSGYSPHQYLYGAPVVIPSSGTVTQLGFWGGASGSGSFGFKLGLYNSSGTLIGQSTASITAGAAAAWIDSGAVSLPVSAGTYYLMVSCQTSSGFLGSSNTGNGTYATEDYATAMQASESLSIGAETGRLFGVRLDFTAGGGGTNNQRGTTLGAG